MVCFQTLAGENQLGPYHLSLNYNGFLFEIEVVSKQPSSSRCFGWTGGLGVRLRNTSLEVGNWKTLDG